jgi:hypothetical protein
MGKSVSRPIEDSARLSSAVSGLAFPQRRRSLSYRGPVRAKENSGYYPFCATMGVPLNFRAISLLKV